MTLGVSAWKLDIINIIDIGVKNLFWSHSAKKQKLPFINESFYVFEYEFEIKTLYCGEPEFRLYGQSQTQ